jgi:hypothetical protein
MKFGTLLAIACLSTFCALPSQAKTIPALVTALSCTGLDARAGATSVTFSGDFGGFGWMNISSLSYGMPFTQQARIDEVKTTTHNSLRFKLQTMITNATLYLELFNDSTRGLLSSYPGDDGEGSIEMNCNAQING